MAILLMSVIATALRKEYDFTETFSVACMY